MKKIFIKLKYERFIRFNASDLEEHKILIDFMYSGRVFLEAGKILDANKINI